MTDGLRLRGVLALATLGALGVVVGAWADSFPLIQPYTIQNDFVRIRVGDILAGDEISSTENYPGHVRQKARWVMDTTGGEPTVTGDENQDLTSPRWIADGSDIIQGINGYTRIAIGDPSEAEPEYTYAIYGAVGDGDDEGTFVSGGGVIQNDLIETYWRPNAQNYVEITQALQIVRDKVRVEYIVHNQSTTQYALIGLRPLIDCHRGATDSGPIYFAQHAENGQAVGGKEESFRVEREWGTKTNPLRRWFWFFAPDSVDSPETVCGGIVESPPEPSSGSKDASVPPDRVLLANWARVFGTEWDATADDSRFAGDDLCLLIYWSPEDRNGRLRTIPPGGKRRYVFYYGLSSATEDVTAKSVAGRPALVGATMAPFALHLTADQQAYDLPSPNGFPIRVDVTTGPGTTSLTGNAAALSLPDGLTTTDARSQSIANLGPYATGSAQWIVRPTGERYGTFTYTVTVTSQGGGSKSIVRTIEVPALPTLTTADVAPLDPPYAGEVPGACYRMFSVPYGLDDSDSLYGLNYVAKANAARQVTPRIFAYDPATRRYDEYPEGAKAREITPGRGYWLLVDEAVQIQVQAGNARPLNAATYVAVPLEAAGGGFNQVGSPFTYAVRLRDVSFQFGEKQLTYEEAVAAGWVRGTVWYWDPTGRSGRGSYGYFGTPDNTLDPWVGYWIKALVDCRMVLTPPTSLGALAPTSALGVRSSAGSALKARSGGTREDWLMQLTATTAEAEDSANFIGVAPSARTGYDPSDVEEPPVIGPYVQLSFPHTNWGRDSGLFTQDIRSAKSGTVSWDAQVRTNLVGQDVTIAWPTIGKLPRDLEAYLEDLDTGKRVFMRSSAGYTFRAGESGVRNFRVVVTTAGQGLVISGMEVEQLARGAGAQIAFALSAPAHVDAVVYNAAGRQVAQVLSDYAGVAGRNTISWNGRGTSGTALPAGQYRVQVTARSVDGGQTTATRMLSIR
ncbi:MAG TPA: FlgD immunoglobulin-like domain containing protein [Armatimonadota bacterium]|nr:FlgD immunoglobulin-like domain containing protein [Armatimonadota bacterium]